MFALRSRLASIIPFSSSIFSAVFSEVGRRANAIDSAAGRQTYPIGGPLPDPSIPIKNSRPYIHPDDLPSTSSKHPLPLVSDDVLSSSKSKKAFRFQAPRPDLTPVAFSVSACLLFDIILEYKDDIKSATQAFIVDPHKPPLFPNAMVRDLLEGKYIDLTKVHGSAMSLGHTDRNFLEVDGSSSAVELSSRTVSRPFSTSTEFFATLDILQSTLGVAFREIIPQFNLYFKHIHSLVHTLGNACVWTNVVRYDAEVRMQLSIQPCIGWDEWNHPLLDGFKSRILFTSNHPSNQSHLSSSALESSSSLTSTSQRSLSASARLPSKPTWKGPLLKTDAHKPIEEQICRRWNANTCSNEKCSRIHNLCNRVGCNATHRGIIHAV